MTTSRLFELRLPDLPLVNGGLVAPHHARGWWWGPEAELPVLAGRAHLLERSQLVAPLSIVRREEALAPSGAGPGLDPSTPTVLLVHALTGDARAGGEAGWWAPLIGIDRPLDPTKLRLLCFNNLGSNYGSSGPVDAGWPGAARLSVDDQARALWLALEALGVERLHLAAGGSLGGRILLAMAAQRPGRIERVMPLGASGQLTAWVAGFTHVQRQVILADPTARGLELARQLATLTYRAEAGLEGTQGRAKVGSYLEHQGLKLAARFDVRAYLSQLDAMDTPELDVERVDADALVVDIDTDALFTPAQVESLARRLSRTGRRVERATVRSPHGHDAFLIEWAQLAPLVTRALAL